MDADGTVCEVKVAHTGDPEVSDVKQEVTSIVVVLL